MQNNYAVLDKYYNVISGSPDFFSFFGSSNFLPLFSQIYEEDREKIRKIMDNITAETEAKSVCRIMDKNENFLWFFLKIKGLEDGLTRFEFIDLDIMDDEISASEIKISILRKQFNLMDTLAFLYEPESGIFKIIRIDASREYSIYNDNLDNVFDSLIDSNYISPESIGIFNDLRADIKACRSSFSHTVDCSAFSEDGEFKVITIKGSCIYPTLNKCVVTGVLIDNSANTAYVYEDDPMTGVLNKVSIINYAKKMLCIKENKNVVLSIVDIDDFKSINDNLGHAMGDNVIIRFANILTSIVGSKGAVGRFGGDEFMVVFDNLADSLEIRTYFRAIRSTVEFEFKKLSNDMGITCSIGIAPCSTAGRDYDKMFKIADACLYLAKDQGKNRYVFYDEKVKEKLKNKYSESALGNKERIPQNNELVFNITQNLFSSGEAAFDDAIKQIGEYYGLYKIKIYEGEDLLLTHFFGENKNELDNNASYVFYDNYGNLFYDNLSFIVERITELEIKAPTAYKTFDALDVGSIFQVVIRKNDKIIGLISFEKKKWGSKWPSSHINSFMIISQLISQIIKQKYNTAKDL